MSRIECLKKQFEETLTPDELIMAIFSKVEEKNIKKDPAMIHQAIFELKKRDENLNKLLEDFIFDKSGITPFSELLDRVLFRLETSCIFGTMNPRYAVYEIKKDLLNETYEKMKPEKKQVIDNLKKDINELIS